MHVVTGCGDHLAGGGVLLVGEPGGDELVGEPEEQHNEDQTDEGQKDAPDPKPYPTARGSGSGSGSWALVPRRHVRELPSRGPPALPGPRRGEDPGPQIARKQAYKPSRWRASSERTASGHTSCRTSENAYPDEDPKIPAVGGKARGPEDRALLLFESRGHRRPSFHNGYMLRGTGRDASEKG